MAEKTWEELSDSEKIEDLRKRCSKLFRASRTAQDRNSLLATQINELSAALRQTQDAVDALAKPASDEMTAAMPTDESDDPFIRLTEAFIFTQGSNSALYHILIDLVIRLAVGQSKPSDFLKNMYESISAKLDQSSFEMEAKGAMAVMRETLATFFSVAEKAVRRRSEGQTGPSVPPG